MISARSAISASPSDPGGDAGARDLRALLRVVQGRMDEATREVIRARDIDPLSLLVNTDVGYVHYYARRNDPRFRRLLRRVGI